MHDKNHVEYDRLSLSKKIQSKIIFTTVAVKNIKVHPQYDTTTAIQCASSKISCIHYILSILWRVTLMFIIFSLSYGAHYKLRQSKVTSGHNFGEDSHGYEAF